ncbi:MAG: hypothetical protein IH856_19465 [Deltaproteobacteria bacterium]|nr:hypothetical protein [Deltaproteobacteria bacterium]
MPGKKPNKKELARMKALSDMGESYRSIARQMRKGHGTVKKYLNSDVFNDPDIDKMVERIKKTEVADLYMLGVKARRNLHVLADEGKMRPIENIALMDRVFQQRRLLEGRTTMNVGIHTQLVLAAEAEDQAQRGKKSPQNDSEVDITPTKTEEPQGDKPMQDGGEGA